MNTSDFHARCARVFVRAALAATMCVPLLPLEIAAQEGGRPGGFESAPGSDPPDAGRQARPDRFLRV